MCASLLCARAAEAPEFRVEGNKALSARRVAELTGLPDPPPAWTRDEWADWAADAALLVREAYRDRGYFDVNAAADPVFDDTVPGSPPRAVVLRVAEGPRYRYGAVRVVLPGPGYPRFDDPGALQARRGRFFSRAGLFTDRRDLLRFYGDAGFLRAQAAESLFIDPARRAVDVSYHVRPGPAFLFDTLLIEIQREGDTTGLPGKTRPEDLRDLFPLKPGDTLSLAEKNAYERKLKSTRVFNFVRLRDSIPPGGGPGMLLLTAEERVPGEAEIAGYWETQYGLGADVSWSHGNLGGTLQEGRAGFTLAQRKQSVLAGYAAPLLFGTSIRFDNEFVANWYQDKRLVRDTGWFQGDFDVSNQSKLSRQLTAWARGVSGAELFGRSERIDSTSRARDFNLNFLNSLYLQRLDTWVNPTKGARLALTWGNGGPLFEERAIAVHRRRHNWLEAEAASFIPLGGWAVLALRLNGGRFFGEGGINAPRFFLGGPRSVRSRDWRTVCPRLNGDGNCVQEGVEPAYLLGSGELRLQPFHAATSGVGSRLSGLQVVPFADYGNVWEPGQPVNASGRGRAVGLGVRYGFLALFNIRVDYALDPRDPSVDRWVFDLAQAF